MNKILLFLVVVLTVLCCISAFTGQMQFQQEKEANKTINKALDVQQTQAEAIKEQSKAIQVQAGTIDKLADGVLGTNKDLRGELQKQSLTSTLLTALACALVPTVIILFFMLTTRKDRTISSEVHQ